VGPSFTVGALALAGPRANAVGAVRIDLAPDALELSLTRVAAFAQGFAPASIATPTRIRVPYTAVRGLVQQGGLLYLSFDPAVVTPYNRFALAGFTDDPTEALAAAFRTRLRARWASFALPFPVGALAAALVPEALARGALGRASVGAIVSLGVFAALRELVAWSTWGGPISDRLRDRFEAELSRQLALVATPVVRPPPLVLRARLPLRRRAPPLPAGAPGARSPHAPSPSVAASAAPPAPEAPAAREGPPRIAPWPLAAALLAACLVVGVMGFVGRFADGRPAPPAIERAQRGLAAAARNVHAAPPPDAVEAERCVCTRADSPLWKDGVPRLAVLTFHGEDEASAPLVASAESGKPRFDFDLAVVNDGVRPLRDVRITLTFARRTAAGRRVGAVDRGLFWEGALAPGAAVKWRVTAPGTEVTTDVSETGTLETAPVVPAPADAFQRLLGSKFRAVRVHAATMLAYLRDPRADAAARTLQATGPAEATTVARIARAAAPLFACDVRREEGAVSACLFNASTKARDGLALREVREGAAAAAAVPIDVRLPVHEGRRVGVTLPDDGGGEIEIVDAAEREP
jgi:hypothetical protein